MKNRLDIGQSNGFLISSFFHFWGRVGRVWIFHTSQFWYCTRTPHTHTAHSTAQHSRTAESKTESAVRETTMHCHCTALPFPSLCCIFCGTFAPSMTVTL